MYKTISKTTGVVILVIVAIVAVMTAGVFIFGWFSSTTAETRGQTGQREATVADPNYRIARYDQFFDACQAIVAKEGDIAQIEQALPTDDATQKFYDNQNLRAMQSTRRDLVTQYNADAVKTATAGQFRASALPSHIDLNGTTTCAG